MRRARAAIAACAVAFVVSAAPSAWSEQATGQAPAAAARPTQWATPITQDGVPNLNRVTANFYRSAQPTKAGYQSLAKDPGIKTVVSLRAFHSDTTLLIGTGIELVSIPIHTWHIETENVVRALAAIRKGETKGGVMLHCQHGADRTGMFTALYRVLYQGWTKDAALDEMKNGAFGYHAVWGNIPSYLRKVDVATLKLTIENAAK